MIKGQEFQIGNMDFAVVGNVTLPVLKVADNGDPTYIHVEKAIVQAKEDPEQKRKTGMEAPELMEVTNLLTGESAQIVVNKVLSTELKEKYPEHSYVHKCFAIRKFKPAGQKKYATFEIVEIAPKQKAANAEVTAKTASKK
jgi:hypothetical protein